MEQGEISLQGERAKADEPNFLGKISEIWLTDQGELGIRTGLSYSLSIKLTKAEKDLLRYRLIQLDTKNGKEGK